MAEQVLHFKAGIELSWIYNNQETQILPESVKSIVVDYDFDKNNMPIIYLNLNIKSAMYDNMVKNVDNAKIYLCITKFNALEDNGFYKDDIKDQFMYFIPTNPDYSASLSDEYEKNSDTESDSYMTTTIGLIKDGIISDNKIELGGEPYYNINKSTLVYTALSHMKKLCIAQFDTNEKFEILITQKTTTVSKFLEYVNKKIKALYDTGYRYFHDFEITYLLSEKGEYVKNGESGYGTVIISVSDTIEDESKNLGYVADTSNQVYCIYVDGTATGTSANKGAAQSVNKAVLVDENGNTDKVEVNENVTKVKDKSEVTDKVEYVRTGQTDKTYMKKEYKSNLTASVDKNNMYVQFSRLQLDDSIITPNKEYRISNYKNDKAYNGTYILASRKTVYKQEDGNYIPTTDITLRKAVSQD